MDEREQEMMRKGEFLPDRKFFGLVKAQLQIFALLFVGDRDDLPLVSEDTVELNQSVARTH